MLVLTFAVACNVLLVVLAPAAQVSPFLLITVLPGLVLLVFGLVTIHQEKVEASRKTFDAGPLASSMLAMSAWVLGTPVLGYWILLLGLVVLPVAAMLLVLAWVQPAERHVALCMVLGVAALPFVIWFAGRADEYLSEAIISGGVVATIVVALSLIRNRGRRDREMAGA